MSEKQKRSTPEQSTRAKRISEKLAKQSLAPLLAVSILAGCGSPKDPGENRENHTTISVVTPAQLPEIVASASPTPEPVVEKAADLCSTDNPVLSTFNNESSSAATQDAKTLLEKKLESNEPVDDETINAVLRSINETYGINAIMPPEGTKYGSIVVRAANPTLDKWRHDFAVKDGLIGAIDALSHFSPDLIKKLGLTNLILADGLDDESRPLEDGEDYAGFYLPDINSVIVDLQSHSAITGSNMPSVLPHELSHAIDAMLCEKEPESDEAFTRYNTRRYNDQTADERPMYDNTLVTPSVTRELVGLYGARNVLEDRAVVFTWTLMQRGMILEGDPDYGSPLYNKQLELVKRLDEVTPGFKDFIAAQTAKFRAKDNFKLS